jgi:hypothetical protein
MTVKAIADNLEPRPYSSREFIHEMGRYLATHAVKKESLVELAFTHEVPIFCPAFTDSSAGFGLVKHQADRPERHLSIDSVRDFYELTRIKMEAKTSGLFMIGGGVPKNFVQDTVICAEVLGREVPMHRYAVQVTVADVRDGACSSSTLKEAASWGKVETTYEQMVYAEATTVVPLIASALYHRKSWKNASAAVGPDSSGNLPFPRRSQKENRPQGPVLFLGYDPSFEPRRRKCAAGSEFSHLLEGPHHHHGHLEVDRDPEGVDDGCHDGAGREGRVQVDPLEHQGDEGAAQVGEQHGRQQARSRRFRPASGGWSCRRHAEVGHEPQRHAQREPHEHLPAEHPQ